MLNSQRFAQCGHLWPSSVFKHSPVDEFHTLTVLSSLPLASSPALDQVTVLTQSLPFSHMSGNTYVVVVYASPPLSGGGVPTHAKLATFRKMRLPVALELLELLATVNIPQPDRLVTRPTDELRWIRRVELDAIDAIAAIFSNVSFTGTTLRLSPPESTPLPR